MDSVLVIDPSLVTGAVQTLAMNTLSAYQNGVAVKWNDAELAVYLVYIFGEINKCEPTSIVNQMLVHPFSPAGGGKGRAAFCETPAVIDKDKRKLTDYSEFALTAHGQMLYTLVQSRISGYPHHTVTLQFFETTTRYTDFFKVRKECIMPTLHAMIDQRFVFRSYRLPWDNDEYFNRGLHNQDSSVRARVFYLFHKFIKEVRNEISPDLAASLLDSIGDLLAIQVDLPELDSPETQDLLTEAIKNPGIFDSQIYLFETAGILNSLFFKDPTQSETLLRSIVKPLMGELSGHLQATKVSNDVTAILKIHHIIMALGNVAKGFPDLPSPLPEGYILPPLEVFREIGQAILVCLEQLNVVKGVRDAVGLVCS
jgi:exportin-T